MEKRDKLDLFADTKSLELWAEDMVPAEAIDCTRCELYKHGGRIIWGEGNPQAAIVVLLDNPGARENKLGEPFVCGSRKTLYDAVSKVGLDENDIYLTFVLRCRPRRKYDKDLSRSTCIKFLHNHLLNKKPKIIFCLGNISAQWYLNNPAVTIKELRGKIHSHENILTAFSYHPLAVRRRPVLLQLFIQDWNLVADFYRTQLDDFSSKQ